MKRQMQWQIWAVAAGLAFMLQGPLGIKAQDAASSQDAQPAQEAQGPQDSQTPDQDPPGRVARLNFMEGSVSFQPGGENDWVDAVVNRPLVTGDNLWADESSRAEVHVGSTALRLGEKTGITLLDVSDRAAQIRLAQGSLIVKVRHVDDEDSYEIDTPNIAFTVLQPGDYRIDVDADGNRTNVTVWHGCGEVTGGGSSYTVIAGQSATFTSAGADHLDYDLGQVSPDDNFDSWALQRDQVEDRSDSANYVSREMTGYEDLDEYGDWSYVAGYGTCWRPRVVVAGWAPYRFGHWIWVGPWGWTWVEDEPWGFAAFHYGRWAFAGTGWVWVPGPVYVRPVWAPALVGWVGGGAGFHFSGGVGVGWFPLAPGEVFIPGYRVSRGYVNSVNVTNTTVNVTRVTNVYNSVVVNRDVNSVTYANRNVSGGVTVVSRDTFVNARPVGRNVMPVPAKELAATPAAPSVAVEPVKSSVLGAGHTVAKAPPAAVTSRPVVALRTPAPMPRSLAQRQAEASRAGQSSGQSLIRQEAPGRPVPVQGTRQPQPQMQDGFRSFGPANSEKNQPKPQPRVWEAQGNPQPEKKAQAQPKNGAQSPQKWSNPLAKPVAPAQPGNEQQKAQKFNNWQQQKPAPAPAPKAAQHSSPPPKPAAPAPPASSKK